MNSVGREHGELPGLGIDMGIFAVKAVLVAGDDIKKVYRPTAGRPVEAARECVRQLLAGEEYEVVRLGLTGVNAGLVAGETAAKRLLEVEALLAGLEFRGIRCDAVLSLGHENMYYLEIGPGGRLDFFNRNGQCAAGSGAFWHQQATRMGYSAEQLAEVALAADQPVKISGRCAVFAKSDMTHAINEGATQTAVSAGLAQTLAEMVINNVAQNRIGPGWVVAVVGGVANNRAVLKFLREHFRASSAEMVVPPDHEYLNALGAAQSRTRVALADFDLDRVLAREFVPELPLPRLDPLRVRYLENLPAPGDYDLSVVYLGVDCGSVSTKCVLLDRRGNRIGGVYLPTAGRPALQVLELMKKVREIYGELLENSRLIACTTGSGRFLSQRILNAEYAVDEITCQAEGIKHIFGEGETLSIIEIGGEDSKFIQLKDGLLYDYNMNPVCAAGTGTFLENLAGLLGVRIEGEFSAGAFAAGYAIDLGDTCTLLSQSALASAASQGLPLPAQLASLAYSSARNYLTKTAEDRPMEGRVVFTGATARNHALASAFAAELGREILVPPLPELTGALGSALMARAFHELAQKPNYSCRSLRDLDSFRTARRRCEATCEHRHNCLLDVISFGDGSSFLYGDRCGRYSGLDRHSPEGDLPDYVARRNAVFFQAAGAPLAEGPTVGIARGGLFFELYPFWAAFFRELGARVVLSAATSEKTLATGKRRLRAEMCFPLEVLVGHFQELADMNVDHIFLPEVIDLEPLPWDRNWPRGFTCPLLQMLRGVVVNSLELEEDRVLYAQLNYRGGWKRLQDQLRPVARRLLGRAYRQERLQAAMRAGYRAQAAYETRMEEEGVKALAELANYRGEIAAVFLGRSYTLYDDAVAKRSLHYARQRGLAALPQEFILAYFRGWYEGRIASPFLGSREEFDREFARVAESMDNIYPAQLQAMLSAAFLVSFLNARAEKSGLPLLHCVLQDPFKCGPNAMLRHYLSDITTSLRLTIDEHTAPAGMVTRLEAFRNTRRRRRSYAAPSLTSARTVSLLDLEGRKVLVPQPSHHARVFAAAFRNFGVDAELLPRSRDSDLSLARRYVNGNECLPMLQNVQDFLEYLGRDGQADPGRVVFFQGWACGPCRYGLYAPTQALLLNRAGYGERRICSVKLSDALRQFGLNCVVNVFDGLLAMDALYKMLHATRPYEKEKGQSRAIFEKYSARLVEVLSELRFGPAELLAGTHLRPLEMLVREAAAEFARVPRSGEMRPRILLAGEFYVRLDDRCCQDIIARIERAGGEVSISPVSEMFSYSAYTNYLEARVAFAQDRNMRTFLGQFGFAAMNWLARRDERRVEQAGGEMLADDHEPSAREMKWLARNYVSEHYGGEPPMAIGRVSAFAGRKRVAGAIFVAPFTCMPGSVVEAQLGRLRRELGLPAVTIYYDGKDNPNREELIEGLVFQAKQRLKAT